MQKSRRYVMKIGAVSTDWSGSVRDRQNFPVMGGAGWIRLGQVAEASRHSWVLGKLAVKGNRLAVRTWDGALHDDLNVIVMQRYLQEEATGYVRAAVASGQIVINDVDDHFWRIHPNNLAHRAVDPKNNKKSNYDHYSRTLSESSLVTVSSPYLAEVVGTWARRVRLIENSVNTRSFPRRYGSSSTKPVIGWCGSTAHRSGDLEILKPVFARLNKVRFRHVGDYAQHPPFWQQVGLSERQVERVPMQPPKQYPNAFTFDIGVAPIVDIPFNRAKSFIKAIEYAAAGVPFVASDVGEYRRLYDEHGVGRLAATTDEWLAHIEALRDPAVRMAEASRQREIVTKHFDVKVQARAWDALINELIDEK